MMRGGSKSNNVRACLLVGGHLQQGNESLEESNFCHPLAFTLVFSLVFNDRRSRSFLVSCLAGLD